MRQSLREAMNWAVQHGLVGVLYVTFGLAVTEAAWHEEDGTWELFLVIVAYGLAVWLAKGYAHYLVRDRSAGQRPFWALADALRSEVGLLVGTIPSALVAFGCALAGLSTNEAINATLAVAVLTVVLVQIGLHLANDERSWGEVLVTVLVDSAMVLLLVSVLILLK